MPNTTILVYYYNAERGLCSGFIHITVDNPLANFANYTAWSITNVIDLGGITFQHRTDQAATIGYLTPRCNSKYFVIWWDRFGSRQC